MWNAGMIVTLMLTRVPKGLEIEVSKYRHKTIVSRTKEKRDNHHGIVKLLQRNSDASNAKDNYSPKKVDVLSAYQ